MIVLLADIVDSREIEDLPASRDRVLDRLSDEHLSSKKINAPYTVTAWDEFQTIVARGSVLPAVIWELRRSFAPIEVRIGLGVGRVDSLAEEGARINEAVGGEAFERARAAIERLRRGKEKFAYERTLLLGGERDRARVVNLVYLLWDRLLESITPRQWETIRAVETCGSGARAAKKLAVAESTISRSLARASYPQIQEANRQLAELMDDLIAP